jgi:DNA polymerase-1
MMVKLLSSVKSSRIVLVFDAGRQTFRNDLFPAYKAHRDACPEDLVPQLPLFRQIGEALGILTVEQKGFEADDILATLAHRFSEEGTPCLVVSGDKDLLQVVTDKVSVWDPMKDKFFDERAVEDHLGIPARLVADYLGLVGDTSDNIPGVSGIGPKTAAALIASYGGIEEIIGSLDDIERDARIRGRAKIVEAFRADLSIPRISKELASACRTVPIMTSTQGEVPISELDIEGLRERCTRQPIRVDELTKLAEQLEFESLFLDLATEKGGLVVRDDSSARYQGYRTVWRDEFVRWSETLAAQTFVSFDLETTSLDPLEATIVGASFCWDDAEAWYVPIAHREERERQIPWEDFKRLMRPILESPVIKKTGHNLKFDLEVLTSRGLSLAGIACDSMVASYVLNPDKRAHGLDVVSREELGIEPISFDAAVKGAGHTTFDEVSIGAATTYAAEDAHLSWLLTKRLLPRVDREGLRELFDEIEVPLIPILADMELRGVRLDSSILRELSARCGAEIDSLERQAVALVGHTFNLNSPKQLSEILFHELQLPTRGLKKTKTGISTDASVLEKLRDVHRTLAKLKSTYLDVLPDLVSPVSGRLHTKFNQTGTGTGRLSSSEPNLQNIPIQTEIGRLIRSAFVAQPGHLLISADYSQIELRLLAHMSEDPALIEVFQDDLDIHAQTARNILGIGSEQDLPKEARRLGKTINFGVIYGMGPFALSQELGISMGEAQRYIDAYFARFPGVKQLFARLEASAKADGFVRTVSGRKRVIADLDSSGRGQGFLARAAINAPLQGSAADLIKKAMIRVDDRLRKEGGGAFLVLQIHDELLLECPEEEVTAVAAIVKSEMEGAMQLLVPLKVDVGWGRNWLEIE